MAAAVPLALPVGVPEGVSVAEAVRVAEREGVGEGEGELGMQVLSTTEPAAPALVSAVLPTPTAVVLSTTAGLT